MTASWMIATLVVSVLIAAAAEVMERVLSIRRGVPLRWIWIACIALSCGYSGQWLLRSPMPVRALPAAPGANASTSSSPVPATSGAPEQPPSARSRFQVAALFPTLTESQERYVRISWFVLSLTLALALAWSQWRLTRERRTWREASILDNPVLISEGFGPAVVGVLRPMVVVPPWVLGLDAASQRTILAHEDEHRMAGDSRLLLVGVTAILVMPWNVGLWFMWRRLGRAIELDCDERVLARGVAEAEYANVLLSAWQRARGTVAWMPSPAMAEHASGLAQRVERLMRPTPRRWIMRALTGSFAAALLLGATFLVPTPPLASQPVPSTPQSQRRAIILVVGLPDSLGDLVAGAVRNRLASDTSGRPLWVIPQKDIHANLSLAGYERISQLSQADMRQLANFVRADILLSLSVEQSAGALRVRASVASKADAAPHDLPQEIVGSVDLVSDQVVQALRQDSTYLRIRRR